MYLFLVTTEASTTRETAVGEVLTTDAGQVTTNSSTTDAGQVTTNSSVPKNESLGRNSINKKGTTSLIFHFGHLPLYFILFYFILTLTNAPT